MTDSIERRYVDHSYLAHNPTWDSEHAPWKAGHVIKLLESANIIPESICDIGCGSGCVLAELKKGYPQSSLYGYDISNDLEKFWEQQKNSGIQFILGDYFNMGAPHYDVILVLDVLEHLANPFGFLDSLMGRANHYIFHIPLDLSAITVAREKPLLYSREKVGHIHYYTKSLALALLTDAGYRVNAWHYTNAYLTAPGRSIKTKIAAVPRMFLRIFNRDFSIRILGGETLIVMVSDE